MKKLVTATLNSVVHSATDNWPAAAGAVVVVVAFVVDVVGVSVEVVVVDGVVVVVVGT